MLILWIRRRKKNQDEPGAEDAESFLEHDEKMRQFRIEHDRFEPDRPEDILSPDGHVLAPVEGVKLPENWMN